MTATHLRVQVIDSRDRISNVAPLQRLPDSHATLYALKVHWGVQPSLTAKFLRGGLISLDYEVIHDQPVHVTGEQSELA